MIAHGHEIPRKFLAVTIGIWGAYLIGAIAADATGSAFLKPLSVVAGVIAGWLVWPGALDR